MKVVLSRKSMDSQYGGIPSPIIQTEQGYQKYFPLPIPFEQSNIKYSDLQLFNNFTVWDFIKDVQPKYNNFQCCHLDPDIRQSYIRNRPEGWQRSFGQVMQAQSHLDKNKIGMGDIFLFFGWFQFAELKDGKFAYKKTKDYPNGFHAIYGYLQVDKIYNPNKQDVVVPEWLQDHPHVKHRGVGYFKNINNTIFTSKTLIDYPKDQFNKNGSVCFTFNNNLILTQKGQENRSVWELPRFIHPDCGITLSYNPEGKRWKHKGEKTILKAAGRGQEFIFTTDPNETVENWCINLIKNHTVTD